MEREWDVILVQCQMFNEVCCDLCACLEYYTMSTVLLFLILHFVEDLSIEITLNRTSSSLIKYVLKIIQICSKVVS